MFLQDIITGLSTGIKLKYEESHAKPMLLALYVLANIISLAMYVWDKHKAKADKWRTPEKSLLIAALIAPWGATLGMNLAHHKTRKAKFKLVYVFLVLHIVLIAWFLL